MFRSTSGRRAATTVCTDSRVDVAGKLFVALRGPNHDGHDHALSALRRGAMGVLVEDTLTEVDVRAAIDESPLGQDAFVVQVEDTGEAFMQLALEHRKRCADTRVVGITGSCGKTSTKDLLSQVCARVMPTVASPGSYNNHVGVPLSLFQMKPGQTRAAVVEIGTNAPGEVAALSHVARPDIAIVTCIAEAHLSGLGTIQGVAAEKAALVRALPREGLCILNGDDAASLRMMGETAARVQRVRIDREADWFATDVTFHGMGTTFLLQNERPVTLPRLGSHNVYNALFTIAAATELGVPLDDVLAAIASTPASARRLESKRAGVDGEVFVFDDTYNANPASARAALHALAGLHGDGRRIAVFGEMLELGADADALHRSVGEEAVRCGVDALVCVGDGSRQIGEGALQAGMPGKQIEYIPDVHAATERLLKILRPGDRLLCKASRGVALDRLVDALMRELGQRATSPEIVPGRDVSAKDNTGQEQA